MIKRPAERINEIASEHLPSSIAREIISRTKEGKLTREENPLSHFCVYFAAYDLEAKKVFIGHHKKSGLWLFNGGHIDKRETPEETLTREMSEEWGVKIDLQSIGKPRLLTITPTKTCNKHYDIWYFVPVHKDKFKPEKTLLDTEFYVTDWKDIKEARDLITDTNTLMAISEFETLFNENN